MRLNKFDYVKLKSNSRIAHVVVEEAKNHLVVEYLDNGETGTVHCDEVEELTLLDWQLLRGEDTQGNKFP